MCLYPEYSLACEPQAVQDRAETAHPLPSHAEITVSGSGLAPDAVYQLALTVRDRAASRIQERVYLALPHNRHVTLRLSCLPSLDPTAPPMPERAPAGQSPTAEGVEARIDIP